LCVSNERETPQFLSARFSWHGGGSDNFLGHERREDCPVTLQKKKSKRDIEKGYPKEQFVAKLRRLADCIEQGRRFRIQVAGERISISPDAVINIEHERGMSGEDVEFQIKWPLHRVS
jgi:amphi-Trp domain-containing protein